MDKLEKEFKDGWIELYGPLKKKRDESSNKSQKQKINNEIGNEFKEYFLNFLKNKNLVQPNYKIFQKKDLSQITSKNKFDFVIVKNNYDINSDDTNNILAVITVRSHGSFWGYEKKLQESRDYLFRRTNLANELNTKLFLISFKDVRDYDEKIRQKLKNLNDYYNYFVYPTREEEFNYDSYESNKIGEYSEFKRFN